MRAEELLPDEQNQGQFQGVTVRKGTVGAFLINARTWLDTGNSGAQRTEAERDIIAALPALHALGLFELLQVRDAKLQELISRSGV